MALGNPDRPIGGLAVRTPPGVELRPLSRDDLAEAAAMARQGRGLEPLDDLGPIRERYESLLNSPDTAAFVAEADGNTAGLVIIQFRRRLNFATFEAWIPELHVDAGGRERGVDRALVDAAVAEWRLRGAHRLMAPVPAGAVPGALEAAGFEEGFLNFRLAPVQAQRAASDSPGVTLRALGMQDGERVTRLIAEFGPRRSPVPERMEAVLRTYADHLRENEAGMAASRVAELDGGVVGIVTMHWQLPLWSPDRHAWVADLVVTERMRGRGIGRMLMNEAIRLAAEGRASEVNLESGEQRLSAHRLYRAIGFGDAGRTWLLRRE